MRELEKQFIGKGQVKGFKFTQIKKTKYGYIYKVRAQNSEWYEVFKRKENTRYSVISYPRNKSFGVWAWSTKDMSRAIDILNDFSI
jgi:hypothetical protein